MLSLGKLASVSLVHQLGELPVQVVVDQDREREGHASRLRREVGLEGDRVICDPPSAAPVKHCLSGGLQS